SGCSAGKTNGVHGHFSSAVAEADHLDRKAIADFFSEIPFQVMRHAEHRAGAQALLNRLHHRGMAMASHDAAKATEVIDVLVAIEITQLAATRVLHKYRVRIISAVVAG